MANSVSGWSHGWPSVGSVRQIVEKISEGNYLKYSTSGFSTRPVREQSRGENWESRYFETTSDAEHAQSWITWAWQPMRCSSEEKQSRSSVICVAMVPLFDALLMVKQDILFKMFYSTKNKVKWLARLRPVFWQTSCFIAMMTSQVWSCQWSSERWYQRLNNCL